jgi:hypothetical protein
MYGYEAAVTDGYGLGGRRRHRQIKWPFDARALSRDSGLIGTGGRRRLAWTAVRIGSAETMTVGTASRTTAEKAGAKDATKVARNRTARRAAKPAAKATWFVAKKVAKRKAIKQARRYGDAARTAWSAVLIYGPMAAEVLGIVEQPKPRRRVPVFLAGIGVGAGLMYLGGRKQP